MTGNQGAARDALEGASPLLCAACGPAGSEYTFAVAGRFLSWKMIAWHHYWVQRTMGTRRVILAFFMALGFSRFGGESTLPPIAANANRWAANSYQEFELEYSMNQKPSDLLLSVLEFFGILIPGAILVFLQGDFLLRPFGLSIGELQSSTEWIPVFFISIILGHFLHGFSDPLDKLLERFPVQKTTAYLNAVRHQISLPPEVQPSPKTLFYFAFSFIRIHDAIAVSELERQAADYKLFRSLTLLFIIDAPLAVLSGSFSLARLVATLLILCLVTIRYRQLYNWCYQLAFDLYLQILHKELTSSKT